jgi:hypothetical protein
VIIQRDTSAIPTEIFAVSRHERVKIIIPLRDSGLYISFFIYEYNEEKTGS